MPDLRKILLTNNALAILPDVYLRDFVGDNGNTTRARFRPAPMSS